MASLFITGSTGFIGRRLVRKIDPSGYRRIYCLIRPTPGNRESLAEQGRFRWVEADLLDADVYAPYLASCDTVIHLAARTGKAAPDEFLRVNALGTQLLVKQCEQNGVKNFLYVSTIAVRFPNKARYYYAQSKELGEQAVRNSRLNYAVVRPTIVIGPEANIWKTLSRLASKPLLLMPGDGKTRIQPIYVEDLIDCLLSILSQNLFRREVLELGGPEEITFEHLLRRIHLFYYGREPSVFHIPIKPLLGLVNFAEKRFSAFPITAGQLSAFSFDGTIETSRMLALPTSEMKDVNRMLEQVISNE
jgi:NADH dehydrogenase